MKKSYTKRIITSIMSIILVCVSGCGKAEPISNESETASEEINVVFEESEAASEESETVNIIYIGDVEVSQDVKDIIDNMTVEEKVCQMIMPAMRYWSETPEDEKTKVESLNETQYEFLTEYNFGGVCLFAQNCTGTEQLARLTTQIQKAASESDTRIPMLLSIDQEGGYITRLSTGTSGIGNMALAATGNPANARTAAGITGEELKALGVNVNFGPDTDVNNNPDNPVIGVRSFSDNPTVVTEYASSYIEGLHDYNIISCIKHFPGHGDTSTDSHVGFPYIDKNLDELNELELIPFRGLTEYTDIIMTAHIQYPQIETATYDSISTGEKVYIPATMSKTIITGILREDMGYNKVVCTDALNMGAIAENFDILDATEYAVNADADILLMPVEIDSPEGLENMRKYISDITLLVENGEISEEELDNSVARILNLKEKYNLISEFDVDVEERVAASLAAVGSKSHHDTEWQLALDAVTEYKNNLGEMDINDDTKIIYICPYDSQCNSFDFAKQKLTEEGIISENQEITVISYDGITEDISEEYRNDIENSDIVILVSRASSKDSLDYTNPENINACFCKGVLDIAEESDKQTILISSQLPYDADVFNADAVYLAYNPSGMPSLPEEYNGETAKYGPNLPVAIYTALSEKEAKGKCPVNLQDGL